MRDGLDDGENVRDSHQKLGRNARPVAGLINPPDTFVAEASDAHRLDL